MSKSVDIVPVAAVVSPTPNPSSAISFKVVVEGALLLASMAAWNNAVQNSIKYLYPYKRESVMGELIFATIVTIVAIAVVALMEYITYLEAVYEKQVTDSITSISEIVPSGTDVISKAANPEYAKTVSVESV